MFLVIPRRAHRRRAALAHQWGSYGRGLLSSIDVSNVRGPGTPPRLREGGDHVVAARRPPMQEPLSAQKQVVTRMIVAVIVKIQLPEVGQTLPPQAIHRVGKCLVADRHRLAVPSRELAYLCQVQPSPLATELQRRGLGDLLTSVRTRSLSQSRTAATPPATHRRLRCWKSPCVQPTGASAR